MRDFRYSILSETVHRPWPMPTAPWVMTQTWNDLLFAHWPIDPSVLASKVPPQLEIDQFDGSAWLGVVPFHMTNVRPRGVPALPRLSAFPELNVRTYVRVRDRPGVYFFSLDASNSIAVWTAKTFFNLPYYTAQMHAEVGASDRVRYRSRRVNTPHPELVGTYGPAGAVFEPRKGTFDYFLTERYCLFTVDRKGRVHSVDIHHPPWPLQRAEADFSVNTMAVPVGIELRQPPHALHFARRQDVVVWMPSAVSSQLSAFS